MTIEHQLRKLAGSSGMTRRGFMQRALALGATTALATTLADQAFAQPKKGGRFRVGLGHGATSDSLDPATFLDLYMQTVNASARNNLTEVAQDGSLIPELAEAIDTADATTWKFSLRQGVEFHNGKTMDADDVMASITHHRGENSKSPAKELLKSIVEMKADGANAVVFTLSEGNADFPFILSDYHIPIMPVSEHGVDWQSGTGTGAYVLESFEPGVRSTLKRNPNFFKEGFGHFDEVEVITIAPPANGPARGHGRPGPTVRLKRPAGICPAPPRAGHRQPQPPAMHPTWQQDERERRASGANRSCAVPLVPGPHREGAQGADSVTLEVARTACRSDGRGRGARSAKREPGSTDGLHLHSLPGRRPHHRRAALEDPRGDGGAGARLRSDRPRRRLPRWNVGPAGEVQARAAAHDTFDPRAGGLRFCGRATGARRGGGGRATRRETPS